MSPAPVALFCTVNDLCHDPLAGTGTFVDGAQIVDKTLT
jgi:hypothetical protein